MGAAVAAEDTAGAAEDVAEVAAVAEGVAARRGPSPEQAQR